VLVSQLWGNWLQQGGWCVSYHAGILEQPLCLGFAEVGNTNGFRFAGLVELLQSFPGVNVVDALVDFGLVVRVFWKRAVAASESYRPMLQRVIRLDDHSY
jgi:hypothetical protein